MNRKNDNILWGIVLIALGIVVGGRVLNLWTFDIFFDGWWTLFIIVPSAIGLFRRGNRWNSLAGIIIGVMLLLAAQDIIRWQEFGRLIVPMLLIIFGLQLVFGGFFHRTGEYDSKEYDSREYDSKEYENKDYESKHHKRNDYDYYGSDNKNYTAIFGSQDIRYPNRAFTGAGMLCIFGGVELDLRDAIITEDVYISSQNIFGGGELYLPSNVKLQVSNVPILGGIDIKFMESDDVNAPTVYVNAVCVCGGLDIK